MILLGLITAVFCGCSREADGTETSTAVTVDEINTIFTKHLPDEQAKIVSQNLRNTKHELKLTLKEYQHLQFAFVNELKEYCRNKHQYDTFSSGATTHDSDTTTFYIKLGRDGGCDYIINSIRSDGIAGNANVAVDIVSF
ncbi:hypothetical protein NT6N_24070 [Oceaniferula spumae]|uniref:Uncharacterized protein n=1 Tax=Oceaniferula spumae TaxID=2979115 RepID=A0AAT9FN79_9BACT